ncbi:MAG TPA: nucleoside hydrolase [Bacillus sp. (in: firmicutes)]|nr:nucleoside hydrolase [Bacillus sp. (in: firmicutes)]
MINVLFFGDPGIDDAAAMMYALSHPSINLVGVVAGYGNVKQEAAAKNTAYLLKLANREDIPLIGGAKGPFSGEFVEYYPEIHGPEGLGPISPPPSIKGEFLNFDKVFEVMQQYGDDLIIVDVGRSTSLAIAFLLAGKEVMNKVKGYYIMGGAFFVPGNVTELAEANFHGDPIASSLVMEQARNVNLFPLNVTNRAIVTREVMELITKESQSPFKNVLKSTFDYYSDAYEKLVPGINGSPFHDVFAMSALVNEGMVQYLQRKVDINICGEAKGVSIADFRPALAPQDPKRLVKIAVEFDYERFLQDFIETMTNKGKS